VRALSAPIAAAAAALVAGGCGGGSPMVRPLQFTNQPYLGIACRTGGVACGRIGIAVWLSKPASSVSATLFDQTIRLTSKRGGSGTYRYRRFWTGFVDADPARAKPMRHYRLRVEATVAGVRARAEKRVLLSPGWG
jgi:hypothetical protein